MNATDNYQPGVVATAVILLPTVVIGSHQLFTIRLVIHGHTEQPVIVRQLTRRAALNRVV